MIARDACYLALDFETTGTVKGFRSLPWQVGAVCVQSGRVDPAAFRLDTLLRVPADYPFAQHAPGVYRKRRAEIAEAPEMAEVWPKLHAKLQTAIPVAHNIATERTILARAAPMTHYPRWVDTLQLARVAFPGERSYALEDLVPRVGLQAQVEALAPGRQAHDAFYDAVACGVLLAFLLSQPGWGDVALEALAVSVQPF